MHSSPDRPRESRVIPRGEFAFSTLLLQKLLPKVRRCAKAEMLEKQPLTRNRTKSAKSEGLERTGPRERISSSDRLTAVPRFVREARGYWRFHRGKIQRRTLAAAGLAERVGFEPTIRFPVYTLSKRAPSATRPSLHCSHSCRPAALFSRPLIDVPHPSGLRHVVTG